MSKLPLEVVQEDTELETRIGRMSERLSQLRWHWTLDESNSDRVSFRQYGRDVGKDHSVIFGPLELKRSTWCSTCWWTVPKRVNNLEDGTVSSTPAGWARTAISVYQQPRSPVEG